MKLEIIAAAAFASAAVAARPGPDFDRCTFDFREASRLHFEKDDPLDSLAVAEPELGYLSMRSPESMIPVAGDKDAAKLLHNFAYTTVEFTVETAGERRELSIPVSSCRVFTFNRAVGKE